MTLLKLKFHKLISLFLLLIALFLFSNYSFAQEDVIKVDTDLVTVPITVFDRQGRYITDLEKENFQIYENGIKQEIAYFEPVNQPLTVFLLVDYSGSMLEKLNELAVASNTFLNLLRPDDQVIVALFDETVDIKNKIMSVRQFKAQKKIELRKNDYTQPVTMVYDAVDKALGKMREVKGRKAIVLFSDGIGSGYHASFKENIKDAEEGESMIYTIQFDTPPKTLSRYANKKKFYQQIDTANKYMQTLAEVTGGRRYKVEEISNLNKTFAHIANELGRQYTIGYYPANSGKKGERRAIKVKVNVPDVAVRARKSYIVREN